MKVAGFGFRRNVTFASLREALNAAGGAEGVTVIATVSDKMDSGAFERLARDLNVPVKAISADALVDVATSTQSGFVRKRFGTGSVAEAVALVAAGRHARLISTRAVSSDRTATAAIAEGEGT
jgi:cobalt-precorrin 5A hydrolase